MTLVTLVHTDKRGKLKGTHGGGKAGGLKGRYRGGRNLLGVGEIKHRKVEEGTRVNSEEKTVRETSEEGSPDTIKRKARSGGGKPGTGTQENHKEPSPIDSRGSNG
jgi:hypothetical protein